MLWSVRGSPADQLVAQRASLLRDCRLAFLQRHSRIGTLGPVDYSDYAMCPSSSLQHRIASYDYVSPSVYELSYCIGLSYSCMSSFLTTACKGVLEEPSEMSRKRTAELLRTFLTQPSTWTWTP